MARLRFRLIHTPDSVFRILSALPDFTLLSSVSATDSIIVYQRWRFMACRVLSGLARTAATRSSFAVSNMHSTYSETSGPDPLALLPAARSPSRIHCCIRWWALTPPFHPLPYSASVYHKLQSNLGDKSIYRRDCSLLRL